MVLNLQQTKDRIEIMTLFQKNHKNTFFSFDGFFTRDILRAFLYFKKRNQKYRFFRE